MRTAEQVRAIQNKTHQQIIDIALSEIDKLIDQAISNDYTSVSIHNVIANRFKQRNDILNILEENGYWISNQLATVVDDTFINW